MSIQSIVSNFVAELQGEIINNIAAAFTAPGRGAPGKPRGPYALTPGRLMAHAAGLAVPLARKGPVQLCPVPGCKNRAAPVFGMVCAKHKDVPKAKIKAYREQRRNKKLPTKKGAVKVKAKSKPKAKPAKKAPAKKGKK